MNLTVASERALVGCVLARGPVELSLVRSAELKPDMFSHDRARVVFEACGAVVDAGRPWSMVEVAAALEQAGTLGTVGGLRGLDELRGEARSEEERSALITHVRDAARLRTMGARMTKLGAAANHPLAIADPARYFAAVTSLSNDAQPNISTGAMSAGQVCMATMTALIDRGKRVSASPSGISSLDKILNPGFKAGKTYLIGARPGAGKSALGVQCLGVGASYGHPHLLFSCEMSTQDVGDRIIVQRTQIDSERFEVGTGEGGLTQSEFRMVVSEMEGTADRPGVSRYPFWVIDDESEITAMLAKAQVWLTTVARPLIAATATRSGVDGKIIGLVPVVMIDYVQRCDIVGEFSNNEQRLAAMSKRITDFARAEKCAMAVMVQANKDGVRENRAPRASDMKGCDALSADADCIILIHRKLGADTADPSETAVDERGRMVEEPGMLIVDKHRGGRVGVAWVTWHGPTVRFTDRQAEGPWVPKQIPAGRGGR